MAFVQFSKVSLSFGDKKILNDVSVNLKTGTKAALTGANGAGKSTLIKIMAGLVEPDSGERIAQKDARIAQPEQTQANEKPLGLLEQQHGQRPLPPLRLAETPQNRNLIIEPYYLLATN